MNAAARLVHRGIVTRRLTLTHVLSRQKIAVYGLSFALLMSTLSTIYVTYVARVFHANFQRNLTEQNHLHVQEGQLLLERSTWMMQARIQQIAEKKLGMIIPNNKAVVMIHE